MDIDREVKTDLRNVLSMVSCAYTYGHGNQIFFGFAAQMTGPVTDQEIEEYAREIADLDGYTEEDYQEIAKTLREWKATYLQRDQKDK